jgi:hypothetical protein
MELPGYFRLHNCRSPLLCHRFPDTAGSNPCARERVVRLRANYLFHFTSIFIELQYTSSYERILRSINRILSKNTKIK